jgi:putative membrane protein insertion efficiency factor
MTSISVRPPHRGLYRLLVAFARRSVLWPVMFYRRVLSPLKRTPSCIYLPTCSQYAIDAVNSRGVVVGGALAVARILRCNPLFHGGYHPVPPHVCATHVQEQH